MAICNINLHGSQRSPPSAKNLLSHPLKKLPSQLVLSQNLPHISLTMHFVLSNGDTKHGERASIYYLSRIKIANCLERAILLSPIEIDSLQCTLVEIH